MDTQKIIGSAVGIVATGVLLYAGYYIATNYIFKKKTAEGMSNAVGSAASKAGRRIHCTGPNATPPCYSIDKDYNWTKI